MGDGYKSRCSDCFNTQKLVERAAKPGKYKATAQKYVEANKEHIQNLKRSHQKANPEKYDEATRKHWETHSEEIKTKARERRQQDLERYREIGRNSYERHAKERRRHSLEYYKLHPEKSGEATYRRRARKLVAGGSHTQEQWQSLKAFYNHKCLCCGKREPEIKLTRDHVLPLTQDDSDSIENIQP